MSPSLALDEVSRFRAALETLQGRTHGDTLALYLALKRYKPRLATVGDSQPGLRSRELEELLDSFYTKTHRDLKRDNGKVCFIFNNQFKPRSSNAQNNWRDFFRYALGVSCLAPVSELNDQFLGEHRSLCKHLAPNDRGELACSLHPIQTKYIRGLDKPKLLHWQLNGLRGTYKLMNLNSGALSELIRPLTSRVPLTALMTALYFGASVEYRGQDLGRAVCG